MSMKEIWKPVDEKHEIFVSDLGRARQGIKMLLPSNAGHGTIRIWPVVDGKYKPMGLARAVLSAFCGPKSYDMIVHYIDGNKHNVKLSNIRWASRKLGKKDPRRSEWYNHGDKNGNFKYDDSVVRKVFDMRAKGVSYKDIANELGTTESWVTKVSKGNFRKTVLPGEFFRAELDRLRNETWLKGCDDGVFGKILGVCRDVVKRCKKHDE